MFKNGSWVKYIDGINKSLYINNKLYYTDGSVGQPSKFFNLEIVPSTQQPTPQQLAHPEVAELFPERYVDCGSNLNLQNFVFEHLKIHFEYTGYHSRYYTIDLKNYTAKALIDKSNLNEISISQLFETYNSKPLFFKYTKNSNISTFLYIQNVAYYIDGSSGRLCLGLDPKRVDPVPLTAAQLKHPEVAKLFPKNGIVISTDGKWETWAVCYNQKLFLPDGQVIDKTADVLVNYVDDIYALTKQQLQHPEVIKYLQESV